MDPNECLHEIGRHLTQKGGDYDRCLELIESLAKWISKDGFKPKENPNAYNWEDVIVGAYWFCADYHYGQWSDEYRLHCLCSKIYTPSRLSNGPEPDSAEAMVYNDLVDLFGD